VSSPGVSTTSYKDEEFWTVEAYWALPFFSSADVEALDKSLFFRGLPSPPFGESSSRSGFKERPLSSWGTFLFDGVSFSPQRISGVTPYTIQS